MGTHREAGGATRGLTVLRRSKMVGISPTKTAPTKTDMHSTQHHPSRMNLKQWIAATLLAMLCHTGIADAAGLGNIRVLSRLGQPFVAEIDLINISNDELAATKVGLAPAASYRAANLSYDPVLNSMRLSVERRANGTRYIRATSSSRVNEPYLDMLVEVASPEGRIQRAYSALLDLPDGADGTAVATAPAAAPVPAARTDVAPPPPRSVAATGAPSDAPRTRKPAAPPETAVAPVAVAQAPAIPPRLAPTPTAPGNTAATSREPVPVAQGKSEPREPTEPPKPPALQLDPAAPAAEAPKPPAAQPAPPAAKKSAPPPTAAPGASEPAKKSYTTLIAGGALALLAAVGGLWALAVRRRKQATSGAGEITTYTEPTVSSATAAAPMATTANATTGATVVPVETVSNVTDLVDPIDEAKVYLEYGQDEQGEKILREALSQQPGNEDIQMLLLDILARRGDKEGFNQLAGRLHKATGGVGDTWKRAMAMGYALDPAHALYSPAADASLQTQKIASDATVKAELAELDIDLGGPASNASNADTGTDILLEQGDTGRSMAKTQMIATAGLKPAASGPKQGLDFVLDLPAEMTTAQNDTKDDPAATAPLPAPATKDDGGLDFMVDFSNLKTLPEEKSPLKPAPAVAVVAPGMDAKLRDELQQKVDLALAYKEMGDKEAALELLSDIERDGDDAFQTEAQKIRALLR